ncbi:MAG: hypothetical protein Q9187_005573, partial [Circinaria calcarea]
APQAFELLIKLGGNINSHNTGEESEADVKSTADFYTRLDETMVDVIRRRIEQGNAGEESPEWQIGRDVKRLEKTGAFLRSEMGLQNYFPRSLEVLSVLVVGHFLETMSICPLDAPIPNTSLLYIDVLNAPHQGDLGNWYLRPDAGGAIIPWVYTIIIFVLHTPTVIIRVVKWEIVQTWCLLSTTLTVAVYIQAYVSTKFAADKILTWTPILLLIDAGSMLQLFMLVVEAGDLVPRVRQRVRSAWQSAREQILPHGSWKKEREVEEPLLIDSRPLWKDRTFRVAALALVFLLVVVSLQVLGLQATVKLARANNTPLVPWCSPLLQPFGVALIDGDCHKYGAKRHEHRVGVGCVLIPGKHQRAWIMLTLVVSSMALVVETVDLVILMLVNSKSKWNGVKMKRPWCTMFGGLVVLGIILGFGIMYAQDLPPGISARVTVVMDLGNKTFVYTGGVTPAGLRGAMIGWNDGLFSSWGELYYGNGD